MKFHLAYRINTVFIFQLDARVPPSAVRSEPAHSRENSLLTVSSSDDYAALSAVSIFQVGTQGPPVSPFIKPSCPEPEEWSDKSCPL